MTNNRIHYIDGMKGIAALIIYTWHFVLYVGSIYFPLEVFQNHDFSKFFIDGCVAVCVFILLSGFSNAYSIDSKPLNIETIRNTIAKRYLRLAIPIAPIILMVACMRWTGLMYNYEYANFSNITTITQYYNTSTMPHLWMRMVKAFMCSPIGDVTGIDLPLWMLKYVFLGAYFILLLYVLTYNMKLKSKLLIIIFATFLSGYLISMYYIPAMVGLIFFLLFPYFQKSHYYLSLLSFLLAIISYSFLPPLPFPLYGVLTSIFIVLMILCNPFIQKILSLHIFKWLGKVSFMLYLIHMPIICSFSCWICVHLPLKMPMTTLTAYFLTLITCLVIAHYFTKVIEDNFSKRVISNILNKMPQMRI